MGQAHDLQGADALLPALLHKILMFLADKAYDATERVLVLLQEAGIEAVIPLKASRVEQRE